MNKVLQQKSWSQTCKNHCESSPSVIIKGRGSKLRQTIANIWAICMVSRINIPPVNAAEWCPNIENFVWSLMFFGCWHFLWEWTVSSSDGCGPHCYVGIGVVSSYIQHVQVYLVADNWWLTLVSLCYFAVTGRSMFDPLCIQLLPGLEATPLYSSKVFSIKDIYSNCFSGMFTEFLSGFWFCVRQNILP